MTPLERAARALWQHRLDANSILPELVRPEWRGISPRWENVREDDKERFLSEARAVLQAIREPSREYVNHVAEQADDVIAWGDYGEFWQAMIDAIISEKS